MPEEITARSALSNAKELIAEGRQSDALDMLRRCFHAQTEFAVVSRASRWVRGVAWRDLPVLKVAFLGGGTLEQLVEFTRFWLLLNGILLDEYLPAYDTWRTEALNPQSGLYAFRPDVVWFFTHWRDARLDDEPNADAEQAATPVKAALSATESLWQVVKERLPAAQLVQNNLEPSPIRAFGNFDVMLPGGNGNLTRSYNLLLSETAAAKGVMLFDYDRLAADCSLTRWHSLPYWFHSKHAFAPELTGEVAFHVARTLSAFRSGSKKVIVLDLDNTIWGGVVGDDGVEGIKLGNGASGEAFVAFQEYLGKLSRRGIVLAVASKNEMDAATAPFKSHPEMRLTLDDIAVFKANWNNKADNIREIAATLNLGLDSFVFVDDNPAERALVRSELPMVAVPEMPTDPAEYIPALERHAFFEMVAYSEEDRARARMYKENASRTEAGKNVTNLAEYLGGLEMEARQGEADSYHLPRMAQLINKSNQFHPTTTRYSEAELRDFAADENRIVRWFSLRDRFGDHGLIAVLILKRDGDAFAIDTWAMSCRVLERGMEEFILRSVSDSAFAAGAARLLGRYIPSRKNALVAGLFDRLGFTRLSTDEDKSSLWELPLPADRSGRELFIHEVVS